MKLLGRTWASPFLFCVSVLPHGDVVRLKCYSELHGDKVYTNKLDDFNLISTIAVFCALDHFKVLYLCQFYLAKGSL